MAANGVETTLFARQVPDVVDLVSGVVYTTRDTLASSFPDSGSYLFRVAGSAGLGASSFVASSPGKLKFE